MFLHLPHNSGFWCSWVVKSCLLSFNKGKLICISSLIVSNCYKWTHYLWVAISYEKWRKNFLRDFLYVNSDNNSFMLMYPINITNEYEGLLTSQIRQKQMYLITYSQLRTTTFYLYQPTKKIISSRVERISNQFWSLKEDCNLAVQPIMIWPLAIF